VGAVLIAGWLTQALPARAWAKGEHASKESQDIAAVIQQELGAQSQQDGDGLRQAALTAPQCEALCEFLMEITASTCQSCIAEHKLCALCGQLRQRVHNLCP
jgi:hypothetical protein